MRVLSTKGSSLTVTLDGFFQKLFSKSHERLVAAHFVVAMRMAVLSGGGRRAGREFVRMVTEKSIVLNQLAIYGITATLLGIFADEIVGKSTQAVGARVRSNRRRLTRRLR